MDTSSCTILYWLIKPNTWVKHPSKVSCSIHNVCKICHNASFILSLRVWQNHTFQSPLIQNYISTYTHAAKLYIELLCKLFQSHCERLTFTAVCVNNPHMHAPLLRYTALWLTRNRLIMLTLAKQACFM